MDKSEVLNLSIESDDVEGKTIKEVLLNLLILVWRDGENFNGKRPFGNSGWQWSVYAVLIKAGAIKGELDEDGYVDQVDTVEADDYICNLIGRCFEGN